jgi:hypothetical protein
MATVAFRIFRQGEHWTIDHDRSISGEYLSRESAFEVAAAEISNLLKVGDGVELVIEEAAPDEPALGTPR